MPLYEYQCDACGRRFELIQKFSDPPVEVCPTCGGAVHKLLSSPAIQFKGSGWYITDYARKDQPDASKSEAAKPDAKTDTSTKAEATKTDARKSDRAKDAGGAETKSEKAEKKPSPTDSTSPSSSKA